MESCSNEFSVLPFFNNEYNDKAHEFLSYFETLLLPRTEFEWGYLFCFAIEVEQTIRYIFFNKECFGCFITSLSQQAHTCLMNFQQVLQLFFGQVADDVEREIMVKKSFKNLCEFEEWDIPDDEKIEELMLNCRTIWRRLVYECIVNNYKDYSETWKILINNVYKSNNL